jgi:hypothetical protein
LTSRIGAPGNAAEKLKDFLADRIGRAFKDFNQVLRCLVTSVWRSENSASIACTAVLPGSVQLGKRTGKHVR